MFSGLAFGSAPSRVRTEHPQRLAETRLPHRYVESQLARLLGAHVNGRRVALGITQKEVARQLRGRQRDVSEFESGVTRYLPRVLNGKQQRIDEFRHRYLQYLDSQQTDTDGGQEGITLQPLEELQDNLLKILKRAHQIRAEAKTEVIQPEFVALCLLAHLSWGTPSATISNAYSQGLDSFRVTKHGTRPRKSSLGLAVDLLEAAASTDPQSIESAGKSPLVIVTARAFQQSSDLSGEIRLAWERARAAALARGWTVVQTIRRRKQGVSLKQLEQAELLSSLFVDLETVGELRLAVDVLDSAPDFVAAEGIGVVQLFPSEDRITRQVRSVRRSSRSDDGGAIKPSLLDDLAFSYKMDGAGEERKAAASELFERCRAWAQPSDSGDLLDREDLPVSDTDAPSDTFVALDHQMSVSEAGASMARYTVKSNGPLMSTMPLELSTQYFALWRNQHTSSSTVQPQITQLEAFNRVRYAGMIDACQAGSPYRDINTRSSIEKYLSDEPEDAGFPYGGSGLSLKQRQDHLLHLADLQDQKNFSYEVRLIDDDRLLNGILRNWIMVSFDVENQRPGNIFFVGSKRDPEPRRQLAQLRDGAVSRADSVQYFKHVHEFIWDRAKATNGAHETSLRSLIEKSQKDFSDS